MIFIHFLVIGLFHSSLANPDRLYDQDGEFLDYKRAGDMLIDPGTIHSEEPLSKKIEKWPIEDVNVIVHYNIENEYIKPVMLAAMKSWEYNTCVKFQQVTEDEKKNVSYIDIKQREATCESMIGKKLREYNPELQTFTDPQVLLMSPEFCRWERIVRLLGYSLGLLSPLMRPDRHKYVEILHENINPKYKNAFMKTHDNKTVQSYLYGFPYDYTSILHYPDWEYSINGQPTLRAVDPNYQNLFGRNSKGPSYFDRATLNRYLGCVDAWKEKCGRRALRVCKNLGYVYSNCKCRCPPGFVGYWCERDVTPKPNIHIPYFNSYKASSSIFTPKSRSDRISHNVEMARGRNPTASDSNYLFEINADEFQPYITLEVIGFDFYEHKDPHYRCVPASLTFYDPSNAKKIIRRCGKDLKKGDRLQFKSKQIFIYLKSRPYMPSYLDLKVHFTSVTDPTAKNPFE